MEQAFHQGFFLRHGFEDGEIRLRGRVNHAGLSRARQEIIDDEFCEGPSGISRQGLSLPWAMLTVHLQSVLLSTGGQRVISHELLVVRQMPGNCFTLFTVGLELPALKRETSDLLLLLRAMEMIHVRAVSPFSRQMSSQQQRNNAVRCTSTREGFGAAHPSRREKLAGNVARATREHLRLFARTTTRSQHRASAVLFEERALSRTQSRCSVFILFGLPGKTRSKDFDEESPRIRSEAIDC